MERYEFADAARRAGVGPDQLRKLVDLGIIVPDADGRFTAGHVRRVELVQSLTAVGIPLDGLGAAVHSGHISLDFLDEPVFERFSALSDVTFAELAERTGAPVESLMVIREAAGSPPPSPTDLIREEELPYARFIAFQVEAGFSPAGTEQLLRVQADGLRRMAETETAWWEAEVIVPAADAGKRLDEILGDAWQADG